VTSRGQPAKESGKIGRIERAEASPLTVAIATVVEPVVTVGDPVEEGLRTFVALQSVREIVERVVQQADAAVHNLADHR